MQEFEQAIYTILGELEEQQLLSYGGLAKLAGFPHHARHVGKVLGKLPTNTQLPWHRVVNAQGKIALKRDCFERQKTRLIDDGFEVDEQGKVKEFKKLVVN